MIEGLQEVIDVPSSGRCIFMLFGIGDATVVFVTQI